MMPSMTSRKCCGHVKGGMPENIDADLAAYDKMWLGIGNAKLRKSLMEHLDNRESATTTNFDSTTTQQGVPAAPLRGTPRVGDRLPLAKAILIWRCVIEHRRKLFMVCEFFFQPCRYDGTRVPLAEPVHWKNRIGSEE